MTITQYTRLHPRAAGSSRWKVWLNTNPLSPWPNMAAPPSVISRESACMHAASSDALRSALCSLCSLTNSALLSLSDDTNPGSSHGQLQAVHSVLRPLLGAARPLLPPWWPLLPRRCFCFGSAVVVVAVGGDRNEWEPVDSNTNLGRAKAGTASPSSLLVSVPSLAEGGVLTSAVCGRRRRVRCPARIRPPTPSRSCIGTWPDAWSAGMGGGVTGSAVGV